ncbi:MAG: hypothetical protein EPN48_06205 [Microbacteriaceae bacterium]|nr:MAG: hypothetical protein EPN48_06205 [Microbacteriaceae bacterium]
MPAPKLLMSGSRHQRVGLGHIPDSGWHRRSGTHDVPDPCSSNVRNTNGLLRQYFPKGTDLSVHSPERLLDVTVRGS